MPNILLAGTPQEVAAMRSILADGHEISDVNIMAKALEILSKTEFDLIMIGVHFDESRMFDLIKNIPKFPKNAHAPLICFCTKDSPRAREIRESVYFASKILGAWMYLDQSEYKDSKEPEAEMRRIIERCLTDEARKETQANRLDIHNQREELLRHRHALDAMEWTVDLEDRLAEFREKLAVVLLELSELQIENIAQQEIIAESMKLEDRVSRPVTQEEHVMHLAETEMGRQESAQLGKEQGVVPGEEAKAKAGRRLQAIADSES